MNLSVFPVTTAMANILHLSQELWGRKHIENVFPSISKNSPGGASAESPFGEFEPFPRGGVCGGVPEGVTFVRGLLAWLAANAVMDVLSSFPRGVLLALAFVTNMASSCFSFTEFS